MAGRHGNEGQRSDGTSWKELSAGWPGLLRLYDTLFWIFQFCKEDAKAIFGDLSVIYMKQPEQRQGFNQKSTFYYIVLSHKGQQRVNSYTPMLLRTC